MSFMQRQITRKLRWVEIDGTCGTTFIPAEDAPDISRAGYSEQVQRETAQVYYEGKVVSVTFRDGYGARLSPPGYLDCTEWTVFDTPEQAKAYLDEHYSEDDDETEADS